MIKKAATRDATKMTVIVNWQETRSNSHPRTEMTHWLDRLRRSPLD